MFSRCRMTCNRRLYARREKASTVARGERRSARHPRKESRHASNETARQREAHRAAQRRENDGGRGTKEMPQVALHFGISAWSPRVSAFLIPQRGSLGTSTATTPWVSSPSIPCLVAWGIMKLSRGVWGCQPPASFARNNRMRFLPDFSRGAGETVLSPSLPARPAPDAATNYGQYRYFSIRRAISS